MAWPVIRAKWNFKCKPFRRPINAKHQYNTLLGQVDITV